MSTIQNTTGTNSSTNSLVFKSQLEKKTVPQLKDLCSAKGLSKTGNKPDIIQRLVEHEFRNIQPIVREETTSSTSSNCQEKQTTIVSSCSGGIEKKEIVPLILKDNYQLTYRAEDGYVDVTDLCKAGNKKFNDWYRIDKTKEFLEELSRSAGIPADLLIQTIRGGLNENRKTWAYPQVAINIAQWISPKFGFEVESWLKNKEDTKIQLNKQLQIGNIIIDVRYEDGYVNATQLGKAMCKEFKHWHELKSTKELINHLSCEVGIPTSLLVESIKGNSSKFSQGSWIHPDLVIQYAQWGSPMYAIVVSRYMRELHLKGSVSLNDGPRSSQELLELQQELMTTKSLLTNKEKLLLTQSEKIDKLEQTIIVNKRHHTYHKFNKGPVLYLISDMNKEKCTCSNMPVSRKIGIEKVDINVRLQQHRTTLPSLVIDYLIYTPDCDLIEKSILRKYRSELMPFINHEWIFNIEKDKIIKSIEKLLKFLCIEYTVENDIEKYNKTIRSITNYVPENDESLSSSSEDSDSDNDHKESQDSDSDKEAEDKSDSEYDSDDPYGKREAKNQDSFSQQNNISSCSSSSICSKPSVSDRLDEKESVKLYQTCISCLETKELSHSFFRNITSYGTYRKKCLLCELKQLPVHIKPPKPIEIVATSSTTLKKICSTCRLDLPYELFSKNKSRPDGMEYTCKNCDNIRKGCKRQFVAKPRDIPSDKAFCSKCETIKPRIDFRADKNRKNGLQAYCNLCANKVNSINKKKKKIVSKIENK